MKTEKLSYAQSQLLAKAPVDWGRLPYGVGCTNKTLEALERRGLVETRIEPRTEARFFSGWQWRKNPLAALAARIHAAEALYNETMTTP